MTDRPSPAPRRVVTGLDPQGRSTVILDGPVPQDGNGASQLVWRTAALPADNSGDADASLPFSIDHLKDGGTTFSIVDLPEGMPRFMHATDTLDYIVILSGRLVMETETEDAILGPGDTVVQRGTAHAWRNDGPGPVRMACITLPAVPVGKGATL
ncbi:MAG: cupin domain-containing protein [Sphingobium sp.]